MKPKRIKCGTPVYHAKFGWGKVLGEWGPLPENNSVGKFGKSFNSCEGVYDVIFKCNGEPFLHCCHREYLRREP